MKKIKWSDRLIDALIIVLLIFGGAFIVKPYIDSVKHQYDARNVLADAKTVRLDLYAEAINAYKDNETIFDLENENGVKKEIYDSIIDFTETECEFYVLSVMDNGVDVRKVIFSFPDYAVIYDNGFWTVERMTKIIN